MFVTLQTNTVTISSTDLETRKIFQTSSSHCSQNISRHKMTQGDYQYIVPCKMS